MKTTIIHQFIINESDSVGGIDTWIKDYIANTTLDFQLLGAVRKKKYDPLPTDSRYICIAKLPVRRRFIPDTLKMALAIVKSGKVLSERIQIHRIEYAPFVRIRARHSHISLFIHTDSLKQSEAGSDSFWRHFKWIYLAFENFALKFPDEIVVYSRTDFARIQKFRPDAKLGFAWFNDNLFFPSPSLKESSQIVWVGRFEEVKDPILALESFSVLAKRDGNVTLDLIGMGALLSKIESRIAQLDLVGRVAVLGPKSQAELAQILRRARALLHTSHFEGSPRILLESLACGTRIVCCAESDPENWSLQSEFGLQTNSRTPKGFADALEEVLRAAPVEYSPILYLHAASRVVRDLIDKPIDPYPENYV